MCNFMLSMIIGIVAIFVLSTKVQATIIIVERKPQSDTLLAPLSLKMSGSIRPEWTFNNDDSADHSNGHDGGSRFRFTAEYRLNQHTSIFGYYELGVDMAHLFGMNGRYNKEKNIKSQRQLYIGLYDDRYGTFTYGHQHGAYYPTVAGKSNVWDNDVHAAGNGAGINGNYDGGGRPREVIKYNNNFGPVTLYIDYLLPLHEHPFAGGFTYRRAHGSGVGLDYKITPDLTWGVSYNRNDALIKDAANNEKKYHQQFSGTGVSWAPSNWYLAGTASYYVNFSPSKRRRTLSKYFAGSGYGLESFVGYTFAIDKPYLKSIQPYVAADSLQLKGHANYRANHLYVGVGTTIGYGLRLYVERTFSSTTDNAPDSTWVTLFYDF